jgi:hypothetical protein
MATAQGVSGDRERFDVKRILSESVLDVVRCDYFDTSFLLPEKFQIPILKPETNWKGKFICLNILTPDSVFNFEGNEDG